jgi:hypothetical protein
VTEWQSATSYRRGKKEQRETEPATAQEKMNERQ